MNPQLGSTSSRAIIFLFLLLAATLGPSAHAAPPAPPVCSISNLPTGPAAFIATAPNLITVLNASTQPITSIACTITVGNGPSNLAFSPDGTQLFVENDTDGTVSVVNLADGSVVSTVTLTGVTPPMTANLAVSPDGTFMYVVSLPAAVVPGATKASLTRIALPVPAGASASPIPFATLPTAVTASGLGIAFTPDATLAYITTEGLTYTVTPSTNAISSTTISANGGSLAIDQNQTFAYTVDVANKGVGGNTVVTKIPLATNAPAPPLNPAPPCNLASTITVAPSSTSGYFSCPGADSVQLIDTTANTINGSNTVSLPVGTSPQGVAVTTNGAFAFVAGGDGSVTFLDTSVVPNTFTTLTDIGFPKKGLGFPPVVVSVTPSPKNVQVKTSQTFTAALPRANNPTVTWSLVCGGGGSSCGSINPATGVFTAPATVPTNPAVTIFADSIEVTNSIKLFFRGRATATITGISVAISPATPTVNINANDQFTLMLTDTTNGGVTWSISCAAGVSLCGTVDTTGLYKAPQIVPSPATVTVTATSNTDNTKFDSKNVTIISNVTVTVTPPAGAPPFLIGQSYTFTAPTTGDVNNLGVTWSLGSCTLTPTAGNPNPCGTIVATTGVYTAPPVTTPANAVKIQATSKADASKFGTLQFTISSNVMITGFQVNGAAPPPQLLIETPSYTLTPVITGDTGQGATWTILSCSAASPSSSKCGVIVASTGGYTPPSIVPYAPLPITPTSTASITFQATSNADPLVSKTFTINIGSTVSITGYQVNGAAPPTQLLIETPAYTLTPVITGDTGQGVTWTILSCSAVNPANATCGKFTNASTGVFAPPAIVPYALPVNPASTATITFQATSVADPKVVFQTIPTISSNVSITGYTINSAAPAPPLLIETPAYALAPVITGDTGQGVTWTILNCSAENPAITTKCGTVSAGGSYSPPKIVPYALPVTPASTASINFQAVSIADPKIVFQPTAIAVASTIQISMPAPNTIPALIEAAVDFTPKTVGGNVTLLNDTNQGVTFAIGGTCFAPPNFGTSPTIPCGSFSGNSYAAPSVVPLAASTPAASLGTAQRAVITITATSVADPVHTASTTFSISSNISFTVPLGTDPATMKNTCNPNAYSPADANFLAEITADPCGFLVKPLSPTLAVGFPASFVESTQQGFGTVTGLTWASSAGAVQPGSGSQTTFTAPASSGSVTITGYAIADFTKKATFAIPVVASKVIPDIIVPPFSLNVPSTQASGSIALDIMGPTSGTITSGCSNFIKLTNTTCSFTPGTTTPSSVTGTTVVTLTLSVTRTGSTYVRPPLGPGTPLGRVPTIVLTAAALLALLALVLAKKNRTLSPWAPASRWSGAIAVLLLCVVVLTWAGACNQFSTPSVPIQPPIPPTPPATGSVTLTLAPTINASASTDSLVVPVSVQ